MGWDSSPAAAELDFERELARAQVSARLFGTPRPRMRLGRFEVLRRLGSGAMGAVYEAFDPERSCSVAIKLLARVDGRGVYYLKREFRSLVELSHPNLVVLHELFQERGHWFFSMELVHGVPFDRWVRPDAAGLDEARLRDALPQLVRAVVAIHAAHKLHCDLKPSNVLVTDAGRVVVLDFGLVSDEPLGGDADSVHTGVVGTPAYLAPERAAGHIPTASGDLYAIGAMLFEALTGRLPFAGGAPYMLRVKQDQPAPSPRSLCHGAARLADLCDLCEALLARDPRDRASAEALMAAVGIASAAERASEPSAARPQASATVFAPLPLVGRQRELDVLHGALAQVRTHTARTLLVGGRSGVGKSALLERFVSELGSDVLVLRGRCYERESVPYKVFDSVADALAGHLLTLPAASVRALVPRHAHSLLRLFPVLGRVDALAAESLVFAAATDARELRAQAFEALRELLLRVTDRTAVVMVVDDLQWGDVDSAHVMARVLGPPQPPPVLFLGAFRDDEVEQSGFLRELLQPSGLTGARRPEIVDLQALPADAALELALLHGQGTVSSQVAAAIATEAEGLPVFIGELVAHYQTTHATAGPARRLPTLEQAICERATALPADALRLLHVLSVAAGPIEQPIALQAAQLPAVDGAALHALRAARVVRVRAASPNNVLETYHDRVRETIAGALEPLEVCALHARIARAMAAHAVVDPERLMVHFAGAGDSASACQAAIDAAQSATAKLAFNRAAELLGQAVAMASDRVLRDGQLHRRHGDALALAGRGAPAAAAYLQAAATAPAPRASELRRLAAEQLLRSGRVDEGLELTRRLFREARLSFSETPAGIVTSYLWNRALAAVAGSSLWRRGRPARSIDLERMATIEAVFRGISITHVARGGALQLQFLRYSQMAGDPHRVVQAMLWYAWSTTFARPESRNARRILAEVEHLAAELGTPYAAATAASARAGCALFRGRLGDVVAPALEAERIFREHCAGSYWEQTMTATYRYSALEHAGEFATLLREVPARALEAQERDDRFGMAFMAMAVSLVHIVNDEPERSLSLLEEQRAQLVPPYATFDLWVALRTIHTLLYLDQGRTALEYCERELARFKSSSLWRGVFLRTMMKFLTARCTLAAWQTAPRHDRARLLQRAERLGREVMATRQPHAQAFGAVVCAEAALRRDDLPRAVQWLEACAAGADGGHARSFTWFAQRSLGQLRGGTDGAELVQRADQILTARGVRAPERFARVWIDVRR